MYNYTGLNHTAIVLSTLLLRSELDINYKLLMLLTCMILGVLKPLIYSHNFSTVTLIQCQWVPESLEADVSNDVFK